MSSSGRKATRLSCGLQSLALVCFGIAVGTAATAVVAGWISGLTARRNTHTASGTGLPIALPASPADGLAVASAEWEQALQASEHPAWPQWRSAWLAGVCADSLGKASDAAQWMARFHQSFGVARKSFPQSDVLYLDIVATRLSPAQQAMTVPSPLGLFCLLADAEPDPFPQVIDELKKARVAAANGSIIDRVRLMSWLLLAGELVVEADTGTPAAGLLRNAVQAFDEGFEILSDVEKAIADDPSQESLLTSNADNALIAMRFDAVRVRQVAIKKREVLAKEKEFERLDALRELIAAEKAVMGQIGRLSMATMDRDWSGAKKAGESALEQISLTQGIARQKRDYYLLDEPKVVDTNDQWKAIEQPIGPISTDIVSSVKVLMGMAAARLAETQFAAQVAGLRANEDIQPQADKEIATLLDAAESLIKRATEKVADDQADGFDPANAIAPYVRGLIAETRARLATYQQLGDATAVKGEADRRQEAIKAYEALKPALEKWGADVTASYLIADAQRRLVAISGAAPAREAATSLSRSGKPAEAWVVLGNAAEVHASKDVAVDRADAARRGRMASDAALAELDRAVASRMIPNADLAAAIARAAIVLDEVGTSLAKRENARPIEVAKKPLEEKLQPVESALRSAIDGLPADAPSRPRGWAWLALCLAYRSQVADDANASSNYVKETQRLAQDALFELSKARPEKDAWDLSYVEAVVAAQLALGHAAAKALPSHRDESRIAFAAAIDNATSLPFADADFRMLGSPLLAALAAGDSGGGVKLAQEERSLRQMMTRFVEASFALRFGSPEQAASQMAEAVTLGNSATDEREAQFDASTELSRADGFDVHISLPDSIRAFAALSQITAGQPEAALRTLVEITSPGAKIPPGDDWLVSPAGQKLVGQVLSRINSPLAGYAVASALESVVDRVDLSRVVETQPLLELAIRAQKQTESLLSATRVAGRYPHIQELNLQLARRLSDPDFHRKQAAAAIETGNVPGAISGLRAALRRQPKESSLWQMLFTLHVNQLAIAYSDDKAAELREELAIATRFDLLTPFHKYKAL
ncbi:MAG: hypothetical protein NTY87_00090 [Planctomycetia bacterium]|nr:hypothetical protein [Planctomycetia bacterium]